MAEIYLSNTLLMKERKLCLFEGTENCNSRFYCLRGQNAHGFRIILNTYIISYRSLFMKYLRYGQLKFLKLCYLLKNIEYCKFPYFIERIARIRKVSHVAFLLFFLLLFTEIVSPNLQPMHSFRLSRLEERIEKYGESIEVAFDSVLEDYIRWHSNVSISPELMRKERILAWNGQGDSGLGDKMRGVLHALMLAIETRRIFLIEDVDEFPIRRIARSGIIKWDAKVDLTNEPKFNWRTSFSRGQPGIRRLSMPQFEQRHVNHRVVRLTSSTYPMYERTVSTAYWRFACRRLRPTTQRDNRCGYLGTMNMSFNKKLYRTLFNPRRATMNIIRNLRSTLPQNTTKFSVVHARLGGKFRKEASTSRFAVLNQNWKKTANMLLDCIQTNNEPLYLATDDESFKDIFRQESVLRGYNIIISPMKPRHSGTVHIDQMYDAIVNTFAEALFMGSSNSLITTGSGMATFAAISGQANLTLLEECELGSNL